MKQRSDLQWINKIILLWYIYYYICLKTYMCIKITKNFNIYYEYNEWDINYNFYLMITCLAQILILTNYNWCIFLKKGEDRFEDTLLVGRKSNISAVFSIIPEKVFKRKVLVLTWILTGIYLYVLSLILSGKFKVGILPDFKFVLFRTITNLNFSPKCLSHIFELFG